MAGSSNNTYYDDKEFHDNQRIKKTQDEVEEVVGIMKMNLEKVLERDNKLTELHDRADALNIGAQRFEKNAVQLKRKMWWKNMKMMLIIGGIVTVLIIIIIVWISSSFGSDDKTTQAPPTR